MLAGVCWWIYIHSVLYILILLLFVGWCLLVDLYTQCFIYSNVIIVCWLVVVGGDGIYHEGVNGLMRRLAREQNINVDDPDETLPTVDITLGLIPCGELI